MMKNQVKKVLVFLIVFVLLTGFSGCSSVPDGLDGQLKELFISGYEMSLAIYGEGLRTDPERGKIGSVYEAVAEDEKYQSVDEMKTAMCEIFCGDYAAVLSVTAFNGVNYEGSTIRKRYVDHEGKLYADISYETQVISRTPDYDTIEVVKANRYMAEIKVDMVDNESGEITQESFIVRYEDNKWKLDGCVL